jgi:hypothetical protein
VADAYELPHDAPDPSGTDEPAFIWPLFALRGRSLAVTPELGRQLTYDAEDRRVPVAVAVPVTVPVAVPVADVFAVPVPTDLFVAAVGGVDGSVVTGSHLHHTRIAWAGATASLVARAGGGRLAGGRGRHGPAGRVPRRRSR